MNRRHLKFMHACLGPYDIPIGIENSCGGEGLFCSLDDIVRFKEMCPNLPMGMLLDAAHANIHVRSDENGRVHEGDIAGYVRQLPFDFLEVHLCDNRGEEDDHKYLGYGNLDISALFGVLKERNFRGKLTLEVCYDRLGGKPLADIHEPAETDGLLISRDTVLSTWTSV
jgi:sugar phosphate isomerase/epimerase